MLQENSNYIIDSKAIKPKEVISIPVFLAKLIQEKYFVGQTGNLWVGNELSA
ncbi:hypothetical protein CLMAG_22180 [Clostridium magnum DSM 2767]|uniref:Uncharacterized protein n=1 Tax=Clostridium magnum DSM 2767 TaxID=1121326 RepID=A0A162TAF0_9CLOT|nr:hypothetical protein CLMAG_22180 [Clostridium magnum DSM 2767]SHH10434.1 hypothetical protein SAMN02745944_00009 [Clostridium magnum DSM 2767]